MVGARTREKVLVGASVAALVIVAGVFAVAVWGRGDDTSADDPLAGLTMPAAPTLTATVPAGAEPALIAYNGYWEVYVAAAAQLAGATPEFTKYMGDPLLTSARVGLTDTRRDGIVYKGRPRWTPRVTAVKLDGSPPSVTIEDCFDMDTWEPVFASTGKSALAPDQAKRYVITSTAQSFRDIGWLMTESLADRSRPC